MWSLLPLLFHIANDKERKKKKKAKSSAMSSSFVSVLYIRAALGWLLIRESRRFFFPGMPFLFYFFFKHRDVLPVPASEILWGLLILVLFCSFFFLFSFTSCRLLFLTYLLMVESNLSDAGWYGDGVNSLSRPSPSLFAPPGIDAMIFPGDDGLRI